MTKPRAHVLVVDDDPAVGTVLGALLSQAGLSAEAAKSGDEALTLLAVRHVDLVITDLRMPGLDGMGLLDELARRWPDLPVVMLTAHGTVARAVEAMKRGAADFLLKPFDREELLYVVDKVLVSAERSANKPPAGPRSSEFIGDSEAMSDVFELIRRAAPGTATVLLRGETGTGKDLVAREIHRHSPRSKQPFVKVQCSGLPDSLLESELFGYERGAFTGATSRKPGRVELAQRGTLFLDEIGDITPAIQVKLLRVLEDREFELLGGTRTLEADVRFVAATHRDLESMAQDESFREDLYYRLNVIPIWLPPLRERTGDIELLAAHFCRTLGAANGKPGATLQPEALDRLVALDWPGNVRQLQNVIERLVVLSEGISIGAADVERELERSDGLRRAAHESPDVDPERPMLEGEVRATEHKVIQRALDRCGGNRTQAARLLGISRRTLYNKLQELGMP